MPDTVEKALTVFQKHWGHTNFRQDQRTAIEYILMGHDVLVVLPTSYGKSAIFQVPALMKPGCALVISPLIALMKDQCDDCAERGIPATYVSSHVSPDDIEERFEDLVCGRYKVFYVAPERIRSKLFREIVPRADISYLVVDEAHAVSVWGHDFRPMYSRIHEVLKLIGPKDRPPVIAVTATATADIEDDIAKGLGMKDDYVRIIGDPIRRNLRYSVEYDDAWGNLLRWVHKFNVRTGRYIVYVGTRAGAERVRDSVVAPEIGEELVGVYHAGLPGKQRTEIQERFKEGLTPVIVATVAFGMGIDVPNIRAVLHFGIPGSIESYVQESGRAGRDGKISDAVLLDDAFSYNLQQMFVDNANPPYVLYEALWIWLHDQIEEGGTLALTGKQIAGLVTEQYHGEIGMPVGEGMVLSALNTMESHGLLARAYARAGVSLFANLAHLELVADANKKTAGRVAAALLKDVKLELPHSTPDVWTLHFDREAFATAHGFNEMTLARTLKKLEKEGAVEIERLFRGKTTRIRKRNADLDEILPRALLIKKRERELKRLQKMVEYVHCEDRVAFIREYFMGGL